MNPPPADRGQATVELALTLPFVVLALLLVVQVLVVGIARLQLQDAAREAARAAAVSADAQAAAEAAAAAVPGSGVRVVVAGPVVEVTVRRPVPTTVPLVGRLVPDVHLEAAAAFRIEGQIEGQGVGW